MSPRTRRGARVSRRSGAVTPVAPATARRGSVVSTSVGPTAVGDVLPLEPRKHSLVDALDGLIEKGVVVDANVVIALAGVDLVCIRLGALVAEADRVLEHAPRPRTSRTSRKPR